MPESGVRSTDLNRRRSYRSAMERRLFGVDWFVIAVVVGTVVYLQIRAG